MAAPYVVPSVGPLPAYGFLRRRRLLPLGDARKSRSGACFNSFSALIELRGEQDQDQDHCDDTPHEVMPAAGGNRRRRRPRRRGRRGHGGSAGDGDAGARGWLSAAAWCVVVTAALVILVLMLIVAGCSGRQLSG